MAIDLNEAIEHHRMGRLDIAASAYRAALAENPDRSHALHLLGLVELQYGRANEAFELIDRAIALDPNEPSYHASLAEVHWALGRRDLAVESCRKSLALKPDQPEVLCNLGATLVEQDDLEAAIACFRAAIGLAPSFFAAHNNLGNALQLRGERVEAIQHLRIAIAINPSSAEVHANLAGVLFDRGEFAPALQHAVEAVRLAPRFALARVRLGNILHALGRINEAETCLREAIRIDPGFSEARAALATVLDDLGNSDQATLEYREALRLRPRDPAVLARLATKLREKLPADDRALIEDLLTNSNLKCDERRDLLFGLVQTLDAEGEYDRAAALANEANALRRDDFIKRGMNYDPDSYTRLVDQWIQAFNPAFFERVRGFGVESEQPIFIVGVPRSGTTLTEQILASLPGVFGAGETPLAQECFDALIAATSPSNSLDECLSKLDKETARRLANDWLRRLESRGGSAARIVDKMPENTRHLGLIAALFPRAKIIHCRRNPRDVAISCWLTNFGRLNWANDPDHIARRIADHRRLIEHWLVALPAPILEIDYESIVADLESTAKRIVSWCGLAWNDACLSFHTTRRAVLTPSAHQVRRPIYDRSPNRGRAYEKSLPALFDRLRHHNVI
jgi:tetratricopeptide (TPR) repeat protein